MTLRPERERERRGKGRWGGGRRRKVYSGANAVNEEDPERDRAGGGFIYNQVTHAGTDKTKQHTL